MQNYLVCEAHNKLNLLWSFIKSHKQQKILVFLATCKQVYITIYLSFIIFSSKFVLVATITGVKLLEQCENLVSFYFYEFQIHVYNFIRNFYDFWLKITLKIKKSRCEIITNKAESTEYAYKIACRLCSDFYKLFKIYFKICFMFLLKGNV